MGAAYYIVLKKTIKDFDTFVNGKVIAENFDYLNKAANKLNVRPLSEFHCEDPKWVVPFLVRHGMPRMKAKELAKPIHWNEASDGLVTVKALLAYVEADSEIDKELAERIFSELKQYEYVLSKADELKIKFYLAIDF